MNRILLSTLLLFFFAIASGQSQDSAIVIQKPRINTYVDTARPMGEIQQNFPYDIALRNAAGDSLNSSSVFEKNGKPTVLMFWLTTCGPCRMELAAISSKFEQWKTEADFNMYAISIDFPHNYEQFVKRVEESQWPFPAYLDTNREFWLIMPGRLNGLPQVFILGKDGNIVHHTRKYAPGDEEKLFELIKSVQ
jgi:cytochrome c biogenesis protein CcmG, thiol:disulfide interchange protein DsbE